MEKFLFKALSHIKTVISHKRLVFKLSIKAGIPFQGIIHDASKFSPVELFESMKYYTDGKQSPILTCKKIKGYSEAWKHHIKVNKHHLEYWIDESRPYNAKLIPYKYWVEIICDNLAAGLNYRKEEWNAGYQLDYWLRTNAIWKEHSGHYIHPAIEDAITEVYKEVAENGIDVITKENLERIYQFEVGKAIDK